MGICGITQHTRYAVFIARGFQMSEGKGKRGQKYRHIYPQVLAAFRNKLHNVQGIGADDCIIYVIIV